MQIHAKPPGNLRRPLLLIDVDGVISLFGPALDVRSGGRWVSVEGIPHFLSEQAGRHLRALADEFECVWCTGWEEKADEHLRHALDLPGSWPHLRFTTPPDGAHWKLSAIDAHAGPDRPLAWIDDSFDDRVHAWAERRRGPTLLVSTESDVGLTEEHVERVRQWAKRLRGDP